ncbi:TPA: DNA transposition protein, partial [Escherichia coli]|nr:DNA transposition protein [Escherichia coli]HBE5760687.1 DNA transposition protein [Escherichia coli]
ERVNEDYLREAYKELDQDVDVSMLLGVQGDAES